MTQDRPEWITNTYKALVASGITFVIGFLGGTVMGIADPSGGWAAWRVGLFVGALLFLIALLVGMIIVAGIAADF